jgi:glycine/D-amino acid oxidase-like deaminating enzyme
MSLVNSSSLPRTADVVILGAGVMGTSIAFHLAKRKAGRIVILDKDRGWRARRLPEKWICPHCASE